MYLEKLKFQVQIDKPSESEIKNIVYTDFWANIYLCPQNSSTAVILLYINKHYVVKTLIKSNLNNWAQWTI